MIFAAAQAANVNDHGHQQDDQINAGQRLMSVYDPGVGESGER